MKNDNIKIFMSVFLLLIFTTFSLNAQLKDSLNQCDYLIITPSQFVNSIEYFSNWRQQKGYNVKIVEIQQIYSEFPDSNKSASIRDFVSYILTYWNDPKPQYLLLVGGVKLLPSYRVKSEFNSYSDHEEDSVSIDEWFCINKYDADTKPDISLGRFPVNTKEELKNLITKTINFEDSLTFKDYQNDFIFLTDITDSIIFETEANSFIKLYLPDNFSKLTIYAGQDSSIEMTRNDLFNGLSEGTLFLSYYGHGAPYKLSKYDLFILDDIDSIRSNSLPFIYSAAACSQSFDLPDDSSLVRKLIVKSKSGTVASITSTGLNFLSKGAKFLSKFYSNIFNDSDITIGKAFLKTKISSYTDFSSADDIFRRYTLLGDPALKIPIDIISQIVDEPIEKKYLYSLKQNYPNPFNPSTTIEYSIPLDSYVTVKVYDILGQKVSSLVSENKKAGNYNVKFNAENLASGIYLYQMKANDFVETKKFIIVK